MRRIGVIAVLAFGCVSTVPRRHHTAYVVDAAIVAAGAIALVAGSAVHSTCAGGDAGCRDGSDAAMESGGVIAFVGVVGALANWLATPWQPCGPPACPL